jgi:hypothetical protein
MGDRPGSFPGCAQVRTKLCRKDYGWFVGLVYDPRGLPGVTTTSPRVVGGIIGAEKSGRPATWIPHQLSICSIPTLPSWWRLPSAPI